ncbi:hypothetical protein CCY01nite_23950 [Chitinophaga cymbidii]|uniref:Lipoprotein n=2 Tax=Chitinophaga cymbidii TaxID=1096750 RepID=A0A512RKD8_9BACT|nr:hypothetical protein CCY01nite_23950 [Chitinophaga cymbidii]
MYLTPLWFCCLLAALSLASCGNRREKEKQLSSTALPVQPDSVAQTTGGTPPSISTDEQKFRTAFSGFLQAVEGDNQELAKSFIRFPLQTSRQWTNEDLKNGNINKTAGNIDANEFAKYYPKIFHADVKRLLPEADEENFSLIGGKKIEEDYYKTLQQGTDPDSELFEVSMQYPEKNSAAESYFTFVFGRVQGEYKVIGYHGKLPVKG